MKRLSPVPVSALTEADKDHIVETYRAVGSVESTRRRLRLPGPLVRDILAERKALRKGNNSPQVKAVRECRDEAKQPSPAALQIGKVPLFDLIEETLPSFKRAKMSYRDRVWNLDDLVREVNRQRKMLEMPQIDYNAAWLV